MTKLEKIAQQMDLSKAEVLRKYVEDYPFEAIVDWYSDTVCYKTSLAI